MDTKLADADAKEYPKLYAVTLEEILKLLRAWGIKEPSKYV